MPQHIDLDLDRERLTHRILFACLGIEAALLLFDYTYNLVEITDIGALERLANVARDDSLGGWFVMTQALMIALTVWAVFLVERRRGGQSWLGPALFFSYMALDEGVQLHSRIPAIIVDKAEDAGRSFEFFPSDPWMLIYLPTYVVLGVLVLRFLRRGVSEPRARTAIIVAFACFAVAIALDFLDGLRAAHPWNLSSRITMAFSHSGFDRDLYDVIEHVTKTVEETLEMLAGTLLWFALLRHLAFRSDRLTIDVGK